jgi:dsDNA-specific endonuclease/ATPase MutS2
MSVSLCKFSFLFLLQRIKAGSTGRSVVLLDEVGGELNPTKGAALGLALLQLFAER